VASHAQLVVKAYPVSFTQYAEQLAVTQPAATAMNSKWEVTFNNRKNTGFWRNNQTQLAYGAFRIKGKKSKNFHGIGGYFYYDKEGNYLRRYRGYLQYAYHMALNKDWRLAGGLSVGNMTYRVGSDDYDGGSSNTLDGSLGFMLYNPTFTLAANIAQLTENQVQPIFEKSVLARYYQLFVAKKWQANEDFSFPTNLNMRIMPGRDPDMYAQVGVLWRENIGLHGLYRWQKQYAVLFGLEKIEWEGMRFKAFFSYDIGIEQRNQAFEISLHLMMPESASKTMKK
jgi:type IX secretion system PorP/SprF family membrane protein